MYEVSGLLLDGSAIYVSFITLFVKSVFQIPNKGLMNGCCLEHSLFISTGLLVHIMRLCDIKFFILCTLPLCCCQNGMKQCGNFCTVCNMSVSSKGVNIPKSVLFRSSGEHY
jgi:hypothetical protein